MNKTTGLLGTLFALAAQAVLAQGFPNKPIRLIVTFPPGGATDAMARGLSAPLGKLLGQPVVVDNRPGANSIIGMEACAKSAPDGYNYCMTNNDAISFNPALYAKLPYDLKDFYPIAKVADIDQVIVAHKDTAGASLRQIIDAAKTKPLTWSNFGPGSMGHLYAVWFNNNAGAQFTPVPYKGAGPAMEASIKGEVAVSLFGVGAALPHLKNGTLKAIAIVDEKRSKYLPDVPTIAEMGYPFVVRAWLGFFAPRAIPDEIARRMNREIGKVLEDAEFREKFLAAQAFGAAPNTPEQFMEFIRADAKVAAEQLRAAKITLE